jgi:hypothetical protein
MALQMSGTTDDACCFATKESTVENDAITWVGT